VHVCSPGAFCLRRVDGDPPTGWEEHMSWMLVLTTVWVALSLALARLIGSGIRMADEREAVAHQPAISVSTDDADAWAADLLTVGSH
jgi:hypothetical protein